MKQIINSKFTNITTTILGFLTIIASLFVIFEQKNINIATLIFFGIGVVLVCWKNKSVIDSIIRIIEKLK